MKPLKEKVSLTLDWTVVKQLRELAEQDSRSLSQFINLALQEYLRTRETKTPPQG